MLIKCYFSVDWMKKMNEWINENFVNRVLIGMFIEYVFIIYDIGYYDWKMMW